MYLWAGKSFSCFSCTPVHHISILWCSLIPSLRSIDLSFSFPSSSSINNKYALECKLSNHITRAHNILRYLQHIMQICSTVCWLPRYSPLWQTFLPPPFISAIIAQQSMCVPTEWIKGTSVVVVGTEYNIVSDERKVWQIYRSAELPCSYSFCKLL